MLSGYRGIAKPHTYLYRKDRTQKSQHHDINFNNCRHSKHLKYQIYFAKVIMVKCMVFSKY